MANLTLTIEDELLRQARLRALEQGQSINSLVRLWLERYVGETTQREASETIIAIGNRAAAYSGARGRSWIRDDAYVDRVERRDA